jgi:hypothetical protein
MPANIDATLAFSVNTARPRKADRTLSHPLLGFRN